MKIIYNPLSGSKIEKFIVANKGEIAPHEAGQLKQYEPEVADLLLSTFGFLEEKTPKEAEEIVARANDVKCEKCEVTFKPEATSALTAHMEKHESEGMIAQNPVIDPSIIPVAETTKVEPRKPISVTQQDDLTPDQGFYGVGVTETRRS